MYTVNMFLGPRGPHGIPMLVSPLVRLQEKPDHFYRGMYAFQITRISYI